MKQFFILFLLSSLAFLGCKDDDDDGMQAELDRMIILEYIADNNLTAEEDPSGLFYVIEEPGGEEKPTLTSSLYIAYKGMLINGVVFDQTEHGAPYQTTLQTVIEGWQIGVPKFGRGGKGKLLIPSHLGYGKSGAGVIPPNSVLIFDIELFNF